MADKARLRELLEALTRELGEGPPENAAGKRSAGRPQIDNEPRDVRVPVMMTKTDKERIEAWAAEHTMARSSAMVLIMRQRLDADGF